MFKRVQFESWSDIVPILAFFITFGVFIYFVVRAIRMKKSKVKHMSQLPLDSADGKGDEGNPPSSD